MTKITDTYNGKAFSCGVPASETDSFRSTLTAAGGAGQKFRLATVIEGERAAKKTADAEPYYGLDVKKDPARFKDSTLSLVFYISDPLRCVQFLRTLRYSIGCSRIKDCGVPSGTNLPPAPPPVRSTTSPYTSS